jgi:hypothetical protein
VISGAPETSQNTRSDLRCPRNLTNHQEWSQVPQKCK